MPLSDEDLKSGNIYNESTDLLANRIDFAWEHYTSKEGKYRIEALKFLIYAFDIYETDKINDQLSALMAERNFFKEKNPEFVPGKSPLYPILSDEQRIIKPIPLGAKPEKPIAKAIQQKELLDVTYKSKQLDTKYSIKEFTPMQRAEVRVHIHKGKFLKNRQAFSTTNMISHFKPEFASYTLNANGELSIFNHQKGSDSIAHSTMNAGSPVVAAGELKIINGQLKGITTYSGHYEPSLFNVYRLLEYFTQHKISIEDTMVYTYHNPEETIKGITSSKVLLNNDGVYQVPAKQIVHRINYILETNLKSALDELKVYTEESPINNLFRFKDVLIKSNLSKERNLLAKEFGTSLLNFKQSLTNISPQELQQKIDELDKLITNIQTRNEALSQKFDKKPETGRLANKMTEFKAQLDQIKKEHSQEEKYHSDLKKAF